MIKKVLVTTEAKFNRLLKAFDKHDRCGYDVEAVGPRRRYSKANRKAFMNVPLSSLQGAAWGFEDGTAFYLPVRHRGPVCKYVWLDEAMARTADMKQVWAHNVKFDSYITRLEGYDNTAWQWRDSMLSAWLFFSESSGIGLKDLAEKLLDRKSPGWEGSLIDKTAEEVLDYVCHDAINTLEVGDLLLGQIRDECPKLAKWFETTESALAELTGRIEEHGIPVDIGKLERTLGQATAARIAEKRAEWDEKFPGLSPTSTKDLQELFEEGSLQTYGKTRVGAHVTGAAVLEKNVKFEGGARAETAQLILDIREASKAKGTYVDGLYEEIRQWPDRRIHSEMLQMGTRTTRYASRNPNGQNQMAHGEFAPLLRAAYSAPEGYVFVAADFSQQEPRIFSHLADKLWVKKTGEHCNLWHIFNEGRDIHAEAGEAISGTRDQGKTFNMGFMMYGGSPTKASNEFGWTKDEAERKIKQAFERFPESPALRAALLRSVEGREPWPYVRTVTGYRRWVPELLPVRWEREEPEAYAAKASYMHKKYQIPLNNKRRMNGAIRSSGERIALNTVIQGSGASMTKLSMLNFDKAVRVGGDDAHICMMTHDDICVMCPSDIAEDILRVLQSSMTGAAKELGYDVPFPTEGKIGKDWSELK